MASSNSLPTGSGSGQPKRPAARLSSEKEKAHPGRIQSRETGDVVADEQLSFAKSWAHFIAGGIGGMTAATLTAPLDVLKTRLQSDFYQQQLRRAAQTARSSTTTIAAARNPLASALHHLQETGQILVAVKRNEGTRALFKGLGPNLVGVVPARAINFYVYGNGKRLIANHFNNGQEGALVHLPAAVAAGIVTSTITNPIWMIKTRLQLDKNVAASSGGLVHRQYRNSFDCAKQILQKEGITSMYKGMSASYLGVVESTMQWVLYEQMKNSLRRREEAIELSGRPRTWWDRTVDICGHATAAGGAKLLAAVLAYPHEVARTRLRQAPLANGRPKYTGLIQCFRLVWREEGLLGLYGGMTPHLLRTVPSAAIMFGMYEVLLPLMGAKA